MIVIPPKCKCYNATSYLPWPALEDLSIATNEYNNTLTINRANYRLLANDNALQVNYDCLSGEFSCCELASSLFSTISSNSAFWDQMHGAAISGISSDYSSTAKNILAPLLAPGSNIKFMTSGVVVDYPSMSMNDSSIPSTFAFYNAVSGAINPEFVQSSTPIHTLNQLVKWDPAYDVNGLWVSDSGLNSGDLVYGCANIDDLSTVGAWTVSDNAYFCAGKTAGALSFKSIRCLHTGALATAAAGMMSVHTSSTNAVIKLDGDEFYKLSTLGILDTVKCKITDPKVISPIYDCFHGTFLKYVAGQVTNPRLITCTATTAGDPGPWKLTHGKITYNSVDYTAPATITPATGLDVLANIILKERFNRIQKVSQAAFTLTFNPPYACTWFTGLLALNGTADGSVVTSCSTTNSVVLTVDVGSTVTTNSTDCAGGAGTFAYSTRLYTTASWDLYGNPGSVLLNSFPVPTNDPIVININLSSYPGYAAYELKMNATKNCCDARIGEMQITPADQCNCPFEVAPKAGC